MPMIAVKGAESYGSVVTASASIDTCLDSQGDAMDVSSALFASATTGKVSTHKLTLPAADRTVIPNPV
jgi:hypothetical protein